MTPFPCKKRKKAGKSLLSTCLPPSLYPPGKDFIPSPTKALSLRSWGNLLKLLIDLEFDSIIRRRFPLSPWIGGAANRKQQHHSKNQGYPFSSFHFLSFLRVFLHETMPFPVSRSVFCAPQLLFPASAILIVLKGAFVGVEFFAKVFPFPRTISQRKTDYD